VNLRRRRSRESQIQRIAKNLKKKAEIQHLKSRDHLLHNNVKVRDPQKDLLLEEVQDLLFEETHGPLEDRLLAVRAVLLENEEEDNISNKSNLFTFFVQFLS
jgi:hypothetical protein